MEIDSPLPILARKQLEEVKPKTLRLCSNHFRSFLLEVINYWSQSQLISNFLANNRLINKTDCFLLRLNWVSKFCHVHFGLFLFVFVFVVQMVFFLFFAYLWHKVNWQFTNQPGCKIRKQMNVGQNTPDHHFDVKITQNIDLNAKIERVHFNTKCNCFDVKISQCNNFIISTHSTHLCGGLAGAWAPWRPSSPRCPCDPGHLAPALSVAVLPGVCVTLSCSHISLSSRIFDKEIHGNES